MGFLYGIGASLRERGRDWIVILLSLLLASGIWLITNLSRDYVTVLAVHVVAETDLEGRAGVSADEAVIRARCRASGFRIREIRRADRNGPVHVRFQPSDFHPVESLEDSYAISASLLERHVTDIFGENVHLEGFVTEEAVFRFPPESFKKVPVVPVKDILFRDQYMEQSPLKVEPDSVTVYGEPLLLERITQVRTEPIRLEDVASSIQDVVPLYPIQGVRFSPAQVKYSLPVTRFVEMTADVPVRVVHVPEGVTVAAYPSQARVTLLSVFPILSDPLQTLTLDVEYEDFARSVSGDCVLQVKSPMRGIISVKMEPEVVHCVEVQR